MVEQDAQYAWLLNGISVLRDEIEYACILEKPDVLMMHAPQLCLLEHFVDHRPHLLSAFERGHQFLITSSIKSVTTQFFTATLKTASCQFPFNW